MRSDRLREIREARHMSQQELADLTGLSLRQISRYENDNSAPQGENLAKLARALDVSADFLTGRSNDPQGVLTDQLSPEEFKLISAFRRGDWREGMKIFAEHKP